MHSQTPAQMMVIESGVPWTVKDVSFYLGFSPRYVYQLARDGVLPAKKCGNRWFFNPSKVRAYAGMEA